jgi:hypothetical protein
MLFYFFLSGASLDELDRMQDGRHEHGRDGTGATCLSPELAALIRDAEHVNGQEYEESLCLRETTSVSATCASSRHRSSNSGAAAPDASQGLRVARTIPRDVESDEDGDDVGSGDDEENTQALVLAATAKLKQHGKLPKRCSDLVQHAAKLSGLNVPKPKSRALSHAAHLHNPKGRGASAAGMSSSSGRTHSGDGIMEPSARQSIAAAALEARELAAATLQQSAAPRIQFPSTSAGKKALKTYVAIWTLCMMPVLRCFQSF